MTANFNKLNKALQKLYYNTNIKLQSLENKSNNNIKDSKKLNHKDTPSKDYVNKEILKFKGLNTKRLEFYNNKLNYWFSNKD
jgi:hypothetical protein